MAHRKEILEQINDTLNRYGLGERIKDGSIIVESIQKLSRNNDLSSSIEGDNDQRAGEGLLVVIDEAHHCTARTYRKLWRTFPKAKFLGMTATPCRMKQEGFDSLFDILICADDVPVFIKNGWLSMYEYYAATPNSDMLYGVRQLRERGADGDYKVGEMGSVMDNRASIGQLYRAYKDYADGMQGIIYAINKLHALHIKQFYEQKGESVALVDSETPKIEREQVNEDYRAGKIKILVNCEIYGEGYDAPFVQFIQLARPTLSLSKYLQQVGRGLRPHKDKKATAILDCVGNYYRFGMPNDVRDWQKMFHEGQMEGESRYCVHIDSQDFRYMAMQPKAILDVDDGHDHEMEQIVSLKDLQREVNRYVNDKPNEVPQKAADESKQRTMAKESTVNIQKAKSTPVVDPDDDKVIYNDFTNDFESIVIPMEWRQDYAQRVSEEKAVPTSTKKIWDGHFAGLESNGRVVVPAIYRDIEMWSDDYAYVTDTNNDSYLVNMKNEIVYKKHVVVGIYPDDIIAVSTSGASKLTRADMKYVDLRDKNQVLFFLMPVRQKVGNLEFIETPGGIYRHIENTKMQFLKADMHFDENGVLKAESIVKNVSGISYTLYAFEGDILPC